MNREERIQRALVAYLEEYNVAGYDGADAAARKYVRRDIIELVRTLRSLMAWETLNGLQTRLVLDAAFPDGVGDAERAANKERGT